MKKSPITNDEIIKTHTVALKLIQNYNRKLTREMITPIMHQYAKANAPVELGRVYEIKPKSFGCRTRPPKGFKRFLPVALECHIFFEKKVTIECGGWWLDELNIGKQWDSLTVFGIGNPVELILSNIQDAILPAKTRPFEIHGKIQYKLEKSFSRVPSF